MHQCKFHELNLEKVTLHCSTYYPLGIYWSPDHLEQIPHGLEPWVGKVYTRKRDQNSTGCSEMAWTPQAGKGHGCPKEELQEDGPRKGRRQGQKNMDITISAYFPSVALARSGFVFSGQPVAVWNLCGSMAFMSLTILHRFSPGFLQPGSPCCLLLVSNSTFY